MLYCKRRYRIWIYECDTTLALWYELLKQKTKMIQIPFNKPYLTGTRQNILKLPFRKISGNGEFTKNVKVFEEKYGFNKCLLTTSCTDALEMAAILCEIKEGDEVIVPSYTFVSSALAFVRQGAKIVFADSLPYHQI